MEASPSAIPPVKCTNSLDDSKGFEVDLDISGIGVLSAFFITSCIVFMFSVIKSVLDHLISVYEVPSPRLAQWSLAFRNTIISFADQQVVTGISVIVGGASQIHKISVYSWEIVVNLAWFSTVTHLITLTSLRDDIHNRRIRSTTSWIRILGMAVLVMLLLFSMYPMGYLMTHSSIHPDFPAWCLYHPEFEWKDEPLGHDTQNIKRKYNWLYIIFAYIALIYSFTTRVIFLQKGKWNFRPPHLLRHTLNPVELLEGRIAMLKDGKRSIFKVIGYKVLRTNYSLLISSIDLYRSTLWEMTWLSAALAWGAIRISLTVELIIPIPQEFYNWKFGQVVPVVLLALPVLAFLETFSASSSSQISSSSSSKVPISKTLKYLNPFRSENFTSHVAIKTQPRAKLYQNRWYEKLIIIQYCHSISLIGILLLQFPGGTALEELTNPKDSLYFLFVDLICISFRIGILFLSTLIFLDKDLRRLCPFSLARNSFVSFGMWSICITVLVGVCLYWDFHAPFPQL